MALNKLIQANSVLNKNVILQNFCKIVEKMVKLIQENMYDKVIN